MWPTANRLIRLTGVNVQNMEDVIIIVIIIIIRFCGLSKQLACIAQLFAIHEFIQSGLEDLQ